jgi:hypothetical protein
MIQVGSRLGETGRYSTGSEYRPISITLPVRMDAKLWHSHPDLAAEVVEILKWNKLKTSGETSGFGKRGHPEVTPV